MLISIFFMAISLIFVSALVLAPIAAVAVSLLAYRRFHEGAPVDEQWIGVAVSARRDAPPAQPSAARR